MKTTSVLAFVLAIGLVFAVSPAVSLAEKPFPEKLLGFLPILHKDNQESCKVCHTQVKDPETGKKDPKWNSFGTAMGEAKKSLKEKNGGKPTFEEMFATVQDADSDGDGVSNIIELVAGTRAGEKESKPTEEQIKDATAKIAEWTQAKKAANVDATVTPGKAE